MIDLCLGPSLAAQGFAASDVILAWPEIVGERLASFTQPMKIEWKRKAAPRDPEARPEPATLVVRVESAFALEMQHLAPVDRRAGQCPLRLALHRQARSEAGPGASPRAGEAPPSLALSEADRRKVDAAVAPIEEDGLRAALDRLGHAVVGATRTDSAPRID